MDGYAVRAADAPGTLELAGRSSAGAPAALGLTPGHAIAISTGAVVPDGADSVVPVEDVRDLGDRVEVDAVVYGDNVRPRGGDVRAGDVVLAAGTVLGAAQIGAAAAAGVAVIACAPRPRVVVVPTGSELRAPGEPLAPGEIYESNAALLLVLCRSAGAEVTRFDPVADNEEDTARGAGQGAGGRRRRHDGRCVGRREGSRAGCAGEARSRGGVLARRGSARQTGGLFGARRDAGVRAARQSGLVAGRVRAVRSAGSAGAPGCGARPVLSPGPSRRHAAPQRCTRRPRPRGASRRRRSRLARAAFRTVLPHDRARCCGRRPRPCAARRR